MSIWFVDCNWIKAFHIEIERLPGDWLPCCIAKLANFDWSLLQCGEEKVNSDPLLFGQFSYKDDEGPK